MAPLLFLAKIREQMQQHPFSSLQDKEIISFTETDKYSEQACLQKLFRVELERNSRIFDDELR